MHSYQRVQQLQMQLTLRYQSKTARWGLYGLKQSGLIKDPLLRRELELVYLDYLSNQGDQDQFDIIIDKQSDITQTFAIFRPIGVAKRLVINT